MPRAVLIILGVHRSGTSVTAGMISQLGLNMGKSVLAGNPTNPKGHFENRKLMYFNERLFHYFNVSWHNSVCMEEYWWQNKSLSKHKDELKDLINEEFSNSDSFFIKDPRLCILLPFYLLVFEEMAILPKFIITLRHPAHVAASLMKRDNFSQAKSYRIYMEHILKAEIYTRGYTRVFTDYDDLIAFPLSEIDRVVKSLQLELLFTPDIKRNLLAFVEPDLNHSETIQQTNQSIDTCRICDVYSLLKRFTKQTTTENDESRIDELYKYFISIFTKDKFPLVSVLIVSNRVSANINLTIKSVANQDYPNIENLILCNIENEQEIDATKKLEYLITAKKICSTNNRAEVLNVGTEQAHGKYIIILDSGTKLHESDIIGKLVSKTNHQDVIVYGNYKIHQDHVVIRQPTKLMTSFRKGHLFLPGSVLVPANILKIYKFNPVYVYFPDIELFTRVYFDNYPFTQLQENLVVAFTKRKLDGLALKEYVKILQEKSHPPYLWLIIKYIQILMQAITRKYT